MGGLTYLNNLINTLCEMRTHLAAPVVHERDAAVPRVRDIHKLVALEQFGPRVRGTLPCVCPARCLVDRAPANRVLALHAAEKLTGLYGG